MDFYQQPLHDQRQRLPSTIRYHCVDGDFAKQKYRDEVVAVEASPHHQTAYTMPTVCFCILAHIPNGVDAAASMTARSTFTTCPGLKPLARWKRNPISISTRPWCGTSPSSASCVWWCSSIARRPQTALYCLGLDCSEAGRAQVGRVVRGAVPDRVSLPGQ